MVGVLSHHRRHRHYRRRRHRHPADAHAAAKHGPEPQDRTADNHPARLVHRGARGQPPPARTTQPRHCAERSAAPTGRQNITICVHTETHRTRSARAWFIVRRVRKTRPFRGNGCGPGTELVTRFKTKRRGRPWWRALLVIELGAAPLYGFVHIWPERTGGPGCSHRQRQSPSLRGERPHQVRRPTWTASRSAAYCETGNPAFAARRRISSHTARGTRDCTNIRSPLCGWAMHHPFPRRAAIWLRHAEVPAFCLVGGLFPARSPLMRGLMRIYLYASRHDPFAGPHQRRGGKRPRQASFACAATTAAVWCCWTPTRGVSVLVTDRAAHRGNAAAVSGGAGRATDLAAAAARGAAGWWWSTPTRHRRGDRRGH